MSHDSAGDSPFERLLVSQAELISRLRRDLDELASEFADTAAGLMGRIDDLDSTNGAAAPRAWNWRGIGPRAEEELWSQLTAWVAWIRHRYPLAKRIPPCWAKHTEVVEELTALWLAWQQAYEDRHASLAAPAEWHDRWLPGVLYRLEHGPFALDCASAHQERPRHAYGDRGRRASCEAGEQGRGARLESG
ncbi:hypothetical protein [Marmoricola sp. URHB0036]|uniref:hypothetical protein n=1 Tax=Marmoricola sp. URHB0036 TaxID=1298863 RepID=UPI000487963E|nr:hypothetical protein [Marmoricola sp. URHB0036]